MFPAELSVGLQRVTSLQILNGSSPHRLWILQRRSCSLALTEKVEVQSWDGRTGTKVRQISVSYRVPLDTKVCSPQQTKHIILSKNNRSALTLWSFLRHLILGLLLVDFLKSITHGNITYSLHELDSALWNYWWDKLECSHLSSLQHLATERWDSGRITGNKVH